MEELLLVNPRRRRSHKGRSAAQRAATRKLLAFNRARRGAGARHSLRRNPVAALANPRRRRRRSRAFRRNPAALTMRRFGRIGAQAPMQTVQNAAVGAVGSILLNTVLSRVPLPVQLMTGRMRYVTQGVAALGLAMLAANFRFVGTRVAAQAAEGALTVVLADAFKDFAAAAGFPLAGMGYYLPGVGTRAVPSSASAPAVHMGNIGKYVSGPGSGSSSITPLRRNFGAMKSFAF